MGAIVLIGSQISGLRVSEERQQTKGQEKEIKEETSDQVQFRSAGQEELAQAHQVRSWDCLLASWLFSECDSGDEELPGGGAGSRQQEEELHGRDSADGEDRQTSSPSN